MSDDRPVPQTSSAIDADELVGALRSLSYIQADDEFGRIDHRAAKSATTEANAVVARLLRKVERMPEGDYRAFARRAVALIAEGLEASGRDDCERRAIELLYRAFDPMDRVLDIDYDRETEMASIGTSERLYEGAGIGVQSSYTTILKALGSLALGERARLIDLGSGFGRVGLVAGLWREDLRFTGYEYVGHRVNSSNASAERAGIGDRVSFIEQDLSARDFEIPSAEAYYMFDPFSAETYLHVLRQLARIGKERAVAVVTKADARKWFLDFVADAGWAEPTRLDENTLLVFRSHP